MLLNIEDAQSKGAKEQPSTGLAEERGQNWLVWLPISTRAENDPSCHISYILPPLLVTADGHDLEIYHAKDKVGPDKTSEAVSIFYPGLHQRLTFRPIHTLE